MPIPKVDVLMLYSHMQIHAEHNDTMIMMTRQWRWATQFLEKYTSHFIWKVCVWKGVGDWTELQYIDPHSYGHQHCVFLVLQGCSTGGPWDQLSAGWWLSLPHLVSNSSDLQLSDLLSSLSYIIVQSPAQYLFSWLARPEYATSGIFGLACLIIIKQE